MYYRSSFRILGPKIKNEDIYYEFTHYNGSNLHLIGFAIGNKALYLYPQGDFRYFYWKGFVTLDNKKEIENLIPIKETVGIGYSTLAKTFYAVFRNNISKLYFDEADENDEVIPHFLEGNVNNSQDYISINFGQKPFLYSIPGFRSYCYIATHLKVHSKCICKSNFYLWFSFFVFILL